MAGSPASVRFRWLLSALTIVALIAGLEGCSGDGDNDHDNPGFMELLLVADRQSLTSYSVSGGSAHERSTATIPGIPGTYTRSGNLVTVTMQKHHVVDGLPVPLDFSAGVGGTATDGMYPPTVVDDDTFTINDPASGTITDGTLLRDPVAHHTATYVQNGLLVTVTLPGHGFDGGEGVHLDFTSGDAVDDDLYVITSPPDANTFTCNADAPATTSGSVIVSVGTNYTIFSIAMHPSGQWVYVTSEYECFNGDPYCWAGDMISRFAINWSNGHLTFEESVRTTDDPSSTSPDPAPVTLVFSPDGTRLVHQDDDLDGLRLWSVDPVSGALALLASTVPNTTGQHGIAISADGTRAYHGNRVFSIGAASITLLPGGSPGEADYIRGTTLFTLIGGGSTPQVRAYSLTDPDLPAQLAASANTPHQARDIALAQNGALIVTSGFGGLKSYAYDGATIVPAVGTGSTELVDGGGAFPAPSTLARVYRKVSFNAAENLCAAAYFTNDPNASIGGIPPSGFILANVAADGSLTLANDYPSGTYTRAAAFVQKP